MPFPKTFYNAVVKSLLFVLQAARIAVKQAKEKGMKSVTVVTDSQFLINGKH